jgi:diguanylate cyclase (GGDEF)-like protein
VLRGRWSAGFALRPETRGWALALVLSSAAATAVVFSAVPLPTIRQSEKLPVLAVILACLAAAAALGRASQTVLWWVLAAAVATNTLALAMSQTILGVVLASAAFSYSVLYAAYAFERLWFWTTLALITAGSLIGSGLSGPGLRWATWAATTGGIVAAGAALGQVMSAMRRYATVDSVTGVLTRTAFVATAVAALAGSRRRGCDAVLALIDLDDFKAVNDTHGHAVGDALLAGAVHAWRERLRAQDILGRAGGDEFVILLPDTGADGGHRLLADLAKVSPIAFSAGLTVAGPKDTLDDLFKRADAGMYAVKRSRPGAMRA